MPAHTRDWEMDRARLARSLEADAARQLSTDPGAAPILARRLPAGTRTYGPIHERLIEASRAADQASPAIGLIRRASAIWWEMALTMTEIAEYQARRSRMEYEEAYQIALLGLHDGSVRFDPDRGQRLSTYAAFWCRSGLSTAERSGRLPVTCSDNLVAVRQTIHRLLGQANSDCHAITTADLAERTGHTESRIRLALMLPQGVSLDATDQDGRPVVHVSDDRPGPEQDAILAIDSARLEQAIVRLDRREARVVRLYYGIGTAPLQAREIAARLRISKQWVSVLRNRALGHLREALEIAA